MALIIKTTELKKLLINGTNIELESIYCRINWSSPIDGKTLKYSLIPFLDKTFYDVNSPAPIYFDGGAGSFVLGVNDKQDLETIHNLIKTELEKQGFEVIIDLPTTI